MREFSLLVLRNGKADLNLEDLASGLEPEKISEEEVEEDGYEPPARCVSRQFMAGEDRVSVRAAGLSATLYSDLAEVRVYNDLKSDEAVEVLEEIKDRYGTRIGEVEWRSLPFSTSGEDSGYKAAQAPL